jgi:hypothetical protein
VNIETKEQSKQWMHTRSPYKLKKYKKTPGRKLMENVFWDRKGELMVGIHAKRDHNSIRSVLRNTKQTALGHSEQKAWNADIWCSAPP